MKLLRKITVIRYMPPVKYPIIHHHILPLFEEDAAVWTRNIWGVPHNYRAQGESVFGKGLMVGSSDD